MNKTFRGKVITLNLRLRQEIFYSDWVNTNNTYTYRLK